MEETKRFMLEHIAEQFAAEAKCPLGEEAASDNSTEQQNCNLLDVQPYGNGHINETYLLTYEENGKKSCRILQKINKTVFPKPEEVMENIVNVTEHLKKKILEMGGDTQRETLNIIPTKDGKTYYLDQDGEYWREYVFVTNATSYDTVKDKNDFYQSAVAFGNFQCLLADFPAETLHETIRQFHDTRKRFADFKKAVSEDVVKRAAEVEEEIKFVLEREDVANYFSELLDRGEIPLRVTHNDTKLNNIMIDDASGKGICVIDLDTVMPGLAMFDFGDSIRFGANTAAEDETDLSRVSCSLELFECYVDGFLKGCNGRLTPKEVELLPMGAKVMTYECGMRFLTDYLQGDVYFKTHREKHNLDRCRTQFALVADMERKWAEMEAIIKKYM